MLTFKVAKIMRAINSPGNVQLGSLVPKLSSDIIVEDLKVHFECDIENNCSYLFIIFMNLHVRHVPIFLTGNMCLIGHLTS
jgi:hypothetical protein